MAIQIALLLPTLAAAVSNGLPSSPLFDPVLFLMRPAIAPVAMSGDAMFHMTTVVIAVMTLALGGIPAAIYEGLRGRTESSAGSVAIWLAATVLIALPGILGFTGYFDIE